MTRRHGKKRWSFLAFILVITLICGSISVSAAPESEDAGSVETATEVVTEQSTPVVEPEPSVSYESVTVEEQPEEPAQEEAEPEASVEESVAEDSEPEITSDADSEETASDSEDPAEEAEEEAEDTESEDAESEDAESEEEAEEAETVSYPAQTFSGRAGGVSVSVSADADVFPEGTTMVVSAVSKNTAMSVAEDASDDNSEVVDAAGVDISFRDADGNEIEPKDEKNVHVSLSLSSALDGESFSVIHYADNGDVETVTEQATASGASFSASAFSIYIISGENPPIATYVFYDADGNEISTQKVKDGEILYSPETPEKDGFIFIGWAESEGADEADTDAFASRTANVSETETIRYYPVYEEAHYVFFMDNQGRVSTTKQGASGDVISTTDVTIPLDSTHSVVGWYYDEDLTEAAEDTITLGTEDITLYPEVEEGHYLYFATGSNATYIAPEFIAADAVTAEPEAPARSGYNFVGWASTSDAATADFVFGNELDANTTIYAVWEARTDVKYTVLYWTENADDEEYSFVSSESRTGTAGQTVNLGSVSTSVLGSESGYFTYDASKSDTDVVVKGDGTTIVNVYFSRNTYTLTFQVRSGFGRRTVATITAKYNAAIADRFNEAPFTTTYNGRAWQDTGSTYSYALQTLDRMPGTNVTFHLYDKSSDTKKTIYYYVQNVDSTLTTWPSTNQVSANYTLLKSVDTYFNFATYNEEYHEIAGFTRFSRSAAGFNGNSRKYFSNNTLYLYYLRNSYNLEFVSGGETVKTESVKYEASLTDLLSYVPDRPNNVPEEFVFRGWYMSSECLDGTEVTLTSMPANNVRVYAKWAPDPVDNIAYLTINGDGGKKTVEVVYGEVINQSDLPSVQDADGNVIRQGDDAYIVTVPEGYEWSGWATKTASGTYVIFNFDTVIQTSVELYPYYISTTRFTVSYDLGNGTGSVVDVKQYAENAEADVKEFTGTAPEGKVFLYWTDGTNNYYPQDKVTITENLTLTAVYGEIPETVTLTYKSAYPDGTEDVTYEVEEDGSTALANNSSFTVLTLAAAGMTEPEGYYFAGWENNGTVYQPDETIGVDWNDPDENVLTAKWGKKKEITLVANSGEYTYDGTEHSAVGVETDTFVIDGETYTVSGYTTENPSATNAGSSTNAISIKDAVVIDEDGRDVTYQFTIHTEDGSLVISPRSVILTSATDSKKYDGTALTNENVTVTGDGFVEGEGAEYDVTGTQTEVGRSQNKFTYELNDGTSARNYEIQTVFGNLEVYKQDGVVVYIAENGRVVTYNGTEQSLTGYEVIAIQVGDEATEIYTESDFTFDGDATAKGTGVGTYEMELKASDFTNTNTNFENVTFVIVDGALEITPKPITLSTETKSWEYDGEEHSAPEVNGTDGFYDRDGITATATETVKNAGDSKTNTITVTGDTKNYDIVKDEGTISVYARDGVVVTITENSDTVVYNGEEQSVTGYTVTSIQIGSEATDLYTAADFTFSGDATAKGTDAGTYDMELKASDFTNTNTNFENVTFVIVDGTLTITQKPITLSTDTQSWEYDGEEHSAPTVSGTEGFYDRDGITAAATSTVKNAGDSKTNTITVTGDTKNYTVTKNEGTISVYANDGVVVTITENSGTKVYNGEEQSVTGYTVTSIQIGSEATDLYTAADFTFNGTDSVSGTDADTYDMELKASDFANTNTNFENVQFVIVDGTLTITPKAVTLSTETKSWEYDGEEHSAPTVSGTEGFYDRDGITATATETVQNAGDSKINTITVTGDTKNYTVTKKEGTISVYANDGVVVTITENSGTKVYNGEEQSVTGYTVTSIQIGSEATDLYTAADFTFSGDATAKGTDAGTYDMGLKASDFTNTNTNFENVTFVIVDGTLTITQKPITLSTDTQSWEYDGEEHSAPTVSGTEGFYDRDGITATATETVQNAGDRKTNAITVTGDTKNYEIVKDEGTISVYAKDGVVVTITENSDSKVYNGEEQSVTGYTVTSIQVGSEATDLYTAADFTFSGDATAKGTDAGTYDMELKVSDFTNTNTNFENVTFVIVDGTLEITQKPITLSTDTQSWEYDGEEHSAPEVSGTEDFYSRDGITVTATETVKNAGDSKINTITVTGDTKNYTVTKNEGTISVYANDGVVVTITENSGTKVYNGEEQSVTGYTVTSIQVGSEATDLYTAADFTFSGDATAKGTDAGTYDMELKASDFTNTNTNFENVTFVIVDGTLEITPKPITLSTDTQSWEYDGEEHSAPTVSGTEGFYDRDGITATATETVKNAGETKTNTITVTGDTKNYTVTKNEGTISIYAQDGVVVTITENSDTVKYNGEEQSVSGYTVTSIQIGSEVTDLYTEADFSFSGDAAAKGTNAGIYDMELTASDFTNTNDNFTNVQFVIVDGSLEISKRVVVLTSATDSKQYDGKALTNDTITVSGDGFAKGEGAVYDVTGSQTVVGSSWNTFTYTLFDAEDQTLLDKIAGLFGDKPSKTTSADNYSITTAEGTLTVTNRDAKYEVTLVANSGTYTYDGTEKTAAGIETDTFEVDGNTYTVSGYQTEDPAETNAGTYTNNITGTYVVQDEEGNDVTDQFSVRTENGSLTIQKKDVTLTSATDTKEYDGTALTNDTVTAVGFVEGEGASYNVTGSQTIVGSSSNTFTYTLQEGTLADNYNITKTEGTLTVTNRTAKYEVTLTANSGTYTYDGTQHTAAGVETDIFEIAGNTYTVSGYQTEDPAETDAGTYTNNITGTYVVRDADSNDVTEQFTVKTENGTLEILKRALTLTSATDYKEYDGKALTNSKITVSGDGFVSGDGASYSVTGSQKLPGTSENTFTYTLNSGTKADNYNITTSFGTLTVTNRDAQYEITLIANSAFATYDGKSHTAAGVTTDLFVVDGETYTVSGYQTSDPSEVNAGSYENNITGTFVVTDADGNDVTEQFAVTVVNGSLEIAKRDIILKSADLSKEYDGKALTNGDTALAIEEGFVDGEGAVYLFTGSQKIPGASSNSFSYTLNEGTDAGNYNITKTEGTLTVTNREAQFEVTLVANSGTFTYDGESHAATGVETDTFTIDGETYTVSGYTTEDPNETNASVYTNNITGTFTVTDADGNDVTSEFKVNTENGTLVINKREVTLTSGSAQKSYDGTPLTNDEITIGGDGFAEGEGANYTLTGSQTLVGSSENTFTYTLYPESSGGSIRKTLAENYNIKTANGTLTVTDEDIPSETVITKTDDGKIYAVGDTITFTITVRNIYDTAQTITIREQSGVTITGDSVFADVAPGAEISTTAEHVVTLADIEAGTYTNRAEADFSGGKTYEGEDTVDEFAHASVNKEAISTPANGAAYALGETVSYQITVTNEGTVDLTDLTVTDSLTGDTWTIAHLAAGKSQIFTTDYVVTEADVLAGKIHNEATVDVTNPGGDDPVPVDPGEEDVPTVTPKSSLYVEKISDAEGTVKLGESITYTIKVLNNGNVTISDVEVVDEMTGDVWTVEKLSPLESATFTTEHVVTEQDIVKGKVLNIATATGKDPNGNEPDTTPGIAENETEPESAHLTLTKTTTSSPKDESGYVTGEKITYEITVLNDGNQTVKNIVVTDELTDDEWSIGDLKPGEMQTLHAEYTVTAADAKAGFVRNVAAAVGDSDGDEDVIVTPGTTEDPVQKDTETPKDTKDPKPGKTVKGSHAKAIKTGDTSNAVLWVIVLVLAAAVVLLMSYRRRNRKDTGSKQ